MMRKWVDVLNQLVNDSADTTWFKAPNKLGRQPAHSGKKRLVGSDVSLNNEENPGLGGYIGINCISNGNVVLGHG